MKFNESNTVEAFIRDLVKSLGWTFIDRDTLPRQQQEVIVESQLREALVRLNPTIAERPERADEVIYRLRAAIMTVATARCRVTMASSQRRSAFQTTRRETPSRRTSACSRRSGRPCHPIQCSPNTTRTSAGLFRCTSR